MTATDLTIGVDPGGRYTGLVAVDGRELLAAVVLDRLDPVGREHGYRADAWADANLEAIDRLLGDVREHLTGARGELAVAPRIAIEDVVAPNPHHTRDDGNALTNVDGILDTAIVLGAVLTRWPGAVLVAPGGNGSKPRGSYPPAIEVPAGGRGFDRRRHARSAYDVAVASLTLRARFHTEGQRAARLVEPVYYRIAGTIIDPR